MLITIGISQLLGPSVHRTRTHTQTHRCKCVCVYRCRYANIHVCNIHIYYLSIVDTQCYIGFRHTTLWFNKCVHYALLTTSVAAICSHTSLQYHWLYSLCCAFYPHDLFISQMEASISHSPPLVLLNSPLPAFWQPSVYPLCFIIRIFKYRCKCVYICIYTYICTYVLYMICTHTPTQTFVSIFVSVSIYRCWNTQNHTYAFNSNITLQGSFQIYIFLFLALSGQWETWLLPSLGCSLICSVSQYESPILVGPRPWCDNLPTLPRLWLVNSRLPKPSISHWILTPCTGLSHFMEVLLTMFGL